MNRKSSTKAQKESMLSMKVHVKRHGVKVKCFVIVSARLIAFINSM